MDQNQAKKLIDLLVGYFRRETQETLGFLESEFLEFDPEDVFEAIENHAKTVDDFVRRAVLLADIRVASAKRRCPILSPLQRNEDAQAQANRRQRDIIDRRAAVEQEDRRVFDEVAALPKDDLQEILQLLIDEHSNKPVYLQRLQSHDPLRHRLVVAMVHHHIRRCEAG